MKDNYILTAESVTEGHPDKLCDTIADAVVDACLTQDAAARVACEVMATAGKIIAAGEITAAKIPDIPAIICRTVREAGYGGNDYEVEVITHEQSPDIAEAVCGGTETGAGDQGILYGFACDETKELLPLPVVLAHRLTRLLTDTRRQGIIPGLRPDGKAQVSVEYRSGVPCRVAAVVVSCQHEEELPLPELRRDILRHVIRPAMQELPLDEHTEVLVNPSPPTTCTISRTVQPPSTSSVSASKSASIRFFMIILLSVPALWPASGAQEAFLPSGHRSRSR